MHRPNRRDYLKNADYKQSMLSTYTDYFSYTNDIEKYCDKLEVMLHKIIEDKVADELFSMQCQISPEDFDKLVEKRFNKLIKEADDEETS